MVGIQTQSDSMHITTTTFTQVSIPKLENAMKI